MARPGIGAWVCAVAIAAVPLTAAAKPPAGRLGIPLTVLIAAARTAPVKLIDALEVYCDANVTVDAWLKRLTVREARRIDWSAGACELVSDLNPNDAGGSYCAQATITLTHPKNRRDRPEIEIYLEEPKHGHPGAAYAFRAMFDSNDGPDYIRFRRDFEAEWRDRFKDTPAPSCRDEP